MFPLFAQAQQFMYVSDNLVITIRSGKGNQYQIVKTAESGEKFEVLEQTEDGYTFIRTKDQVEGWVRTQYLSKTPAASQILAYTKTRLAKQVEKNKQLQAELDSLKSNSGSLENQYKSLSEENTSLKEKLTNLQNIAARPIQLEADNKKLRQANVAMEKEMQMIGQENQVLKDRSQREWFIAGALVLLAGLIIGLIIPKIRWKKRSSW